MSNYPDTDTPPETEEDREHWAKLEEQRKEADTEKRVAQREDAVEEQHLGWRRKDYDGTEAKKKNKPVDPDVPRPG